MRFIWHEKKRQSNIQKHGLDFAEAHHVFSEEIRIISMRRANKHEQRLYFKNLYG